MQKVGDSVEEKAELLRILILFPDQYSAHSRLVELAITKGAEAITEHLSFLRAQQQIHPLLRGIRLAEIDLTLKTDTAMSSETGALKLLCVYVDLFSNRQCCFSDLRPFLESLATSSEGTTALFSLSEWLEKQANNVLTAISSFNTESDNRQLPDLLVQLGSFFKLRLFIFHIIESKEQPPLFLTSLPSTLMSVHNNTRNRCPAPIGGEREVQPGDELLMTVLSYCRELRRKQSSDHSCTHLSLQSAFLQVAIALHGSSCSPFSFSLKVRTYRHNAKYPIICTSNTLNVLSFKSARGA